MPHFTILPTDDSRSSIEIAALDAAGVLSVVGQLDCREADVMRDGAYSFSLRLTSCGMWAIYNRDHENIPSFG
jgi:hypothetical protein